MERWAGSVSEILKTMVVGYTPNARENLEGFHEGKQLDHISILESLESKGHVKSPKISKERLAATCHNIKIQRKFG